MTVLLASVLNKAGRTIFSRQFVSLTRVRAEGLLAAFPKLLVGSNSNRQHTFVETDSVRYLYQPIEAMYLVIVTTKLSNILEDLETLSMLAKLIPEHCIKMDEPTIMDKAFDLIFAFDEVISVGYREKVSLAQIRTFVEMDSHQARIQKVIDQEKIAAQIKKRKEKEKEIDRKKREAKQMGQSGRSMLGGVGGGGGGVGSSGSNAIGSVGALPSASTTPFATTASPTPTPIPKRDEPAGLKLGAAKKKGPATDLFKALQAEGEEIAPIPSATTPSTTTSTSLASASTSSLPSINKETVHIEISEKLTVGINKDGGMRKFEIKGQVGVLITDAAANRLSVSLKAGANDGFKFVTNPNVAKDKFSAQKLIALKDPAKPFPLNKNTGVVKWRYASSDESAIPFTINAWPSVSGGEGQVSVEYELTNTDLELRDVCISIPCDSAPQISSVDGMTTYDTKTGMLNWTHMIVDSSNASGALEFIVPASDESSFFPINVNFSSLKTFCDVSVASVNHVDTGAALKFSTQSVLQADNYTVS